MNKKLLSIAQELSEKEIQALIRLKKHGGKKLTELNRERKKLLSSLAKIEKQILDFGGDLDSAASKRKTSSSKGRRGSAGKAQEKSGFDGSGLTEAMREVMTKANSPLRASDIVEALPENGFKVKDVMATRKRVSIILATQKKSFHQTGRGLYVLAD